MSQSFKTMQNDSWHFCLSVLTATVLMLMPDSISDMITMANILFRCLLVMSVDF